MQADTPKHSATSPESWVIRLLRAINLVHHARIAREKKRVRDLRGRFLLLGVAARPPGNGAPEYDVFRAQRSEARTLLHAARRRLGQPVVTAADVVAIRAILDQANSKFIEAVRNCPDEPEFVGPLPNRIRRYGGSAGGFGADGGSGGDSGDSGGGDCGGGGDGGGGGGCD